MFTPCELAVAVALPFVVAGGAIAFLTRLRSACESLSGFFDADFFGVVELDELEPPSMAVATMPVIARTGRANWRNRFMRILSVFCAISLIVMPIGLAMQVQSHAVTLSEQDQQLVDAAKVASGNAYTPYSRFNVGAALRCEDGTVITGCNVENASFGLTVCAERTAFVRAIADGHRAFDTIAVWVESDQGQPCGACRQFMSEFGLNLRVLYISSGQIVEKTISDLLPDTFVPGALDR